MLKKIIKNKIILGIIITLSIFILTPIFVLIFKLFLYISNLLPDFMNFFIVNTNDYTFDLKEYFTFSITFLQIIITGGFSYVIWKTSQRSNKLSKEIKEKEERRDNEIVKENSLIVYYDLLVGLKNLMKLYKSRIINSELPNPKRLYFSDEWIKNVAVLKNELEDDDINLLYLLYGDLHTIKDFLHSQDKDRLDEEINKLFKKVFNKSVIDFSCGLNESNIDLIIKVKYHCIFKKLRNLTFSKNKTESKMFNNNKIKYQGEFEKGIFKNGVKCGYYTNGQEWYRIKYENGFMKSGIIYKKDGSILSEGIYEDNVLWTGEGHVFDDRGNLLYIGEVYEGQFHGEGTEYKKGKKKREGTWKNDKFGEGIEYRKRVNSSDGPDILKDWESYQQEIEINQELYYDEDYIRSRLKENAEGWVEYADVRIKNSGEKLEEIDGTRIKKFIINGKEV